MNPDNEYENIARSLGHLVGFAPGILSAPLKAVGLGDIKPLTKEQKLRKAGVASTYLFNVNNE